MIGILSSSSKKVLTAGPNFEHSGTVLKLYTHVTCEGRFFIQLKNRLITSCQAKRAGTAPTQPLKASSKGVVTADTSREFQRRIVEGKKELL